MIEIFTMLRKAEDYESYEKFLQKYETTIIESYEEYMEQGHSWC